MNVFELIRKNAAVGDKVAVEDVDGRKVTYPQLIAQSAQIANVLASRGLSQGDRVAVQVDKSIDNLVLYLAALRSGIVYLPLNTAYTPAELRYFIEDAEPALIVCDPARRSMIAGIAEGRNLSIETLGAREGGSLLEAARQQSGEWSDIPRADDDLASILYTSGTTGRSKGAMLTHGNLSSNALTLREYWRFTSNDILVHALPLFHAHGLFVACNTLLAAAGSMLFLPRFDADKVIELLPQATSMMGVPTFYSRLLNSPDLDVAVCSNIRLFISGSAPLSAEVHTAFRERTGHAILERYGMTETSMNTSNPYDGDRIAGSVGFPLPGVDLRITDPESGRELETGQTGAIEVRGPNVFKGYWRMPEKTKSEFRADRFFVTADLGLVDERGYVRIVGRAKDLIISGGFNVYPVEVEDAINSFPEVEESAVFGCPHADFGESVTAVVVLRPGSTILERELLDRLVETLAKFKLPKRMLFVDEIPRNALGKILKSELRNQYKTLYL